MDEVQKRNIFETPSNMGLNNLMALLRFSIEVLSDYNQLPIYTRDIIDTYKKLDLFERNSMDVFAALYILKGKKQLNHMKSGMKGD